MSRPLNGPTGPTRLIGRLRRWYRRAGDLGAAYYNAPYRAAIARARRDEEDLFMLMVFSETLGIPNPALDTHRENMKGLGGGLKELLAGRPDVKLFNVAG